MGVQMSYTTLLSTAILSQHIGDPTWAICDCRFDLADPFWGEIEYQKGHIPGAIYAHLDNDLSSPVIPGKTGRHPLPEIETLCQKLSEWGIGEGIQVVAYDSYPEKAVTGAARLWWLLRWLGHEAVAVLDGGWQAWSTEGNLTSVEKENPSPRVFRCKPQAKLLASTQEVDAWRLNPDYRVFDSRSTDRYRGENETIDPVAGHIPGAISAPFAENCTQDGHFQTQPALRARFGALLGDIPPDKAVFYCGSGVTAAYNLLAMAHAGMSEARLYAGSWSEWITDSSRPVTLGAEEK
jgi:thiosulfate/3-mercaptopyruvate sulfurtransferase